MGRTGSGAIIRHLGRTWRVNCTCALTLDLLMEWCTLDDLLSALASNHATTDDILRARVRRLLGDLLELGIVCSPDWETTAAGGG